MSGFSADLALQVVPEFNQLSHVLVVAMATLLPRVTVTCLVKKYTVGYQLFTSKLDCHDSL